jgi:hypothetical protein
MSGRVALGFAAAAVLLVASACSSGRGIGDPAKLVLTPADVDAAADEESGPADLLDEAPAELRAALLPKPGRLDWRAYEVDFRRLGIASLAVTVREQKMAEDLVDVAPSLARFSGMTHARPAGRATGVGDEGVLMHGTVLTPSGQVRTGGAVVWRRSRAVGVIVAQTLDDAERFAAIQAKKTP